MAYILWMIYALLGISQWKALPYVAELRNYIEAAAYLLLLAQFLTRAQYTRRDIAGLFLIAAGCALTGHSLYNKQLIPTVIFLYFSRNIDYRRILRQTFGVQAVFMAATITASQAGLIEDIIWNEQGRMRHSLGYNYCGYPAHLLLFMTLMWFGIRKKLRIREGLLFLALNGLMYLVTDSRTDFALSVLGIAGFFVWTRECRFRWMDRLREFAEKYAFPVLAVGMTAIQFFYRAESTWMRRLNEALNGRLELGNRAIRTYGFSLFGEEIQWFGQGSLRADPDKVYNYVDCSFLKETLTYGVLFIVILALGYYFLGRKLAREKEHALGWAILVTLAYSTINAHLCVLTFNVFILALGKLLADKEAAERVPETDSRRTWGTIQMRESGMHVGQKLELSRVHEKLGLQLDKLMGVIADFCPPGLSVTRRHFLRIAVMTAVLCYVTAIQGMGANVLSRHASMHMWLVCGALLTLTILCCEGDGQKRPTGGGLLRLTVVFLLLACVSDLIINKRFRYGGFWLLAFGGLFCRAWCNMRRPEQLIGELRSAYRLWLAAVLVCCVVLAAPAAPGICYAGIFADAGCLGVSMLPAFAVFLSGVTEKRTGIPDGVCAALTLYLIWMSQQTLTWLAAAGLLGLYLIFWLCLWIKADGREKLRQMLRAICAAAFGMAAVLLFRELLYHAAPLWGSGLAFEQEMIRETVPESLAGGGWLGLVRDRLRNCGEYLKQLNLLGHKYLASFDGKKHWAQNSIVMNGFRYGVAAGAAYAVLLAAYLWRAVRLSVRDKNFFAVGTAAACLTSAMTEAVEMPFAQATWLILYFGLAWILVSGRGEKKDAVSEHRNRQSEL